MSKFLVTMQYNEKHLLPIFLKHYEKYFDKKDIYIIDHGSTMEFDYSEYNHIRLPREKSFCEQDRLEFIQNLTKGLLNYYDYGVYADCDELICLDFFQGDFDSPVYYVAAFDVFKKDNRLYGIFDSISCKPLIFNKPLEWQIGFHGCQYAPEPVVHIPMAHIRFYEDHTEERINARMDLHENMDQIEKALGKNYHWSNKIYYNRYKNVLDNFDKQRVEKFTYAPSNPIIKPINNDAYHTLEGDLENVIFDITDYFVDLV